MTHNISKTAGSSRRQWQSPERGFGCRSFNSGHQKLSMILRNVAHGNLGERVWDAGSLAAGGGGLDQHRIPAARFGYVEPRPVSQQIDLGYAIMCDLGGREDS